MAQSIQQVSSKNSQLLAQYIKIQHLPADFKPSPKLTVDETSNLLFQCFDFNFAEDQQNTGDKELLLYNPLTGMWESVRPHLPALLEIIRPNTSKITLNRILQRIRSLLTCLRGKNSLRPYSGSRYLLFTNCVLDIKDYKIISLTDPLVKTLRFTQRHLLNIPYVKDAPNPVYKSDGPDGDDWSPEDFISSCNYFQQDPEQQQKYRLYFLFCLSLGLFSGHNTGIHVDFQSSIRFDEILHQIFSTIYNDRFTTINYSDLNKNFPFVDFNPDTNIFLLKECNSGSTPLNNTNGAPLYDVLADDSARIPIRHRGDVILNNPPQVYVIGNQPIQGPISCTNRTMDCQLAQISDINRSQFDLVTITKRFADIKVLQYLVSEMIKAFRTFVREERIPDFKMDSASQSDLDLLPSMAFKNTSYSYPTSWLI